MFRQIYLAQGPSGPNREYVFKLEDALNKLGKVTFCFISIIEFLLTIVQYVAWTTKFKYFLSGVVDQHVQELANAVREYSDTELAK